MKIVFFGTPEYVLPVLTALHKRFVTGPGKSPIVSVVTQGPKPTGRKQILTYSPIDKWAHEKKIPTYYKPIDLVTDEVQADLGVLAAYGEIIPPVVLEMFPKGILNIHPSLLPKFRGASPIQAAIITGENVAGSTIIKLDEALDHGPILTQFKEDVLPEDTGDTLRERLFQRSAEVLVEMIEAYLKGKINSKLQDHENASFTTQIKKEHGFIPPEYLEVALQGGTLQTEWEIPFIKNVSIKPTPENIVRFVRAMNSWPGAWTEIKILSEKDTKILRLKILKSHIEEKIVDEKIVNALVFDEVQLEGKNPVTWNQLKLGYPELLF